MNLSVKKEIRLPEEIFDARYHSSKENLLCAVTIAGNVHVIENGETKLKLRRHHKGSPIRRVRFNKDGHMISIAKTIKIHDLEADSTLHTLKRTDDTKTTFYSVNPLSNNIICAGDDEGKVFVWDTRSPESPIFQSCDCDQYISGIDGHYESRRMFVCSSGEGTLTAYDLRANKMIEPQSELFEAGFQCVKLVDSNKKAVLGGEDGAVYVFNQGEWAHTSGKYSFSDDAHNRGKCSIEDMDVLPDDSIFVCACSDGRVRAVSLWPHKVISEETVCRRNSLDTIQVNPHTDESEILVGGDKYINLLSYSFDSDGENDSDSDKETTSSGPEHEDVDGESDERDAKGAKKRDRSDSTKKIKAATDDYLNIFQ